MGMTRLFDLLALVSLLGTSAPGHAAALSLPGYADAAGAIAVQHQGGTVDPYFVLQALLLARQHGLDTQTYDVPWARWLLARQKPDATFDRFCRTGPAWTACKTADADDALLALWMRFIDTLPPAVRQEPAFVRSQAAAGATLQRLVSPPTGVYLVSPVYMHALFMDNLEVWSALPGSRLARSIHNTFWDAQRALFRVSTQPEHPHPGHTFYPDATAQIYPLLMGYPIPGGAEPHYQRWMDRHRSVWLQQVGHEFPWGLIAIVLGSLIGITAGYAGGRVNSVMMRTIDVFYAFPSVLLAIALSGALGAGITNSLISLTIVFIPPIARVAESVTTQIRGRDFVDAARASGANAFTIVRVHVLGNVLGPIFVYATSLIAVSMILASGLSFLGLGVKPPEPEWGLMLNTLRTAIYVQPWVAALPGAMIFITSITFNLLADGLRAAMEIKQ